MRDLCRLSGRGWGLFFGASVGMGKGCTSQVSAVLGYGILAASRGFLPLCLHSADLLSSIPAPFPGAGVGRLGLHPGRVGAELPFGPGGGKAQSGGSRHGPRVEVPAAGGSFQPVAVAAAVAVLTELDLFAQPTRLENSYCTLLPH